MIFSNEDKSKASEQILEISRRRVPENYKAPSAMP